MLPGVHEASEKPLLADLRYRPRHRIGATLGLKSSTKGVARPLQRAVDTRGRAAERLRHLPRAPCKDVAEDQHCALAGRKDLHERDEGQGDALLLVEVRGWVGRIAQKPIGIRLEMRYRHDRRWAPGPFFGPEESRPPSSGQLVQAGVGGDPVEPSTEWRPPLERSDPSPGLEQGLLEQVIGVRQRRGHAVAVEMDLPTRRSWCRCAQRGSPRSSAR